MGHNVLRTSLVDTSV